MEQLNKVVLVIDHLWPDGAQRQFVSLVTNLSASGISCTVCSMISGGPLAEALRKEGIPVREGNKKDRSEVFRLIGFVRDVLREEKPQVLQSFLFYSNNLSRIAGRWERVPVIVTSQRCAPYKKFIPFPARIFESLILGFSHTTVVNFLPPGIFRRRSPLVYIPNGVDSSRFHPQLSAAVQENDSATKHTGPSNDFHDPSKLPCFQRKSAYTPDPTAEGQPFFPNAETPFVLAPGRLDSQKGHKYLIQAMVPLKERFPSIKLGIAGRGSLREKLERSVSRNGLESHVFFLGFRTDIESLYDRADVVVNPSLFEGMPNTVMEAMACGRPVVATNVGATSALIRDRVEGCVIPPGDPDSLVRKITWVLENRERAMEMGRAARKRIEEEFTTEKMTEMFLELYQDLWRKRKVG